MKMEVEMSEKFLQAVSQYTQAIAQGDQSAHYSMAKLYWESAQACRFPVESPHFQIAEEHFLKAIQFDKKYFAEYKALIIEKSNWHRQLGQFDQAIKLLTEMQAQLPDNEWGVISEKVETLKYHQTLMEHFERAMAVYEKSSDCEEYKLNELVEQNEPPNPGIEYYILKMRYARLIEQNLKHNTPAFEQFYTDLDNRSTLSFYETGSSALYYYVSGLQYFYDPFNRSKQDEASAYSCFVQAAKGGVTRAHYYVALIAITDKIGQPVAFFYHFCCTIWVGKQDEIETLLPLFWVKCYQPLVEKRNLKEALGLLRELENACKNNLLSESVMDEIQKEKKSLCEQVRYIEDFAGYLIDKRDQVDRSISANKSPFTLPGSAHENPILERLSQTLQAAWSAAIGYLNGGGLSLLSSQVVKIDELKKLCDLCIALRNDEAIMKVYPEIEVIINKHIDVIRFMLPALTTEYAHLVSQNDSPEKEKKQGGLFSGMSNSTASCESSPYQLNK